ncbi:MAG: adenylate/guanylate cyclase domain-containing protein, partial [Alphaproteobacteria bacterium]
MDLTLEIFDIKDGGELAAPARPILDWLLQEGRYLSRSRDLIDQFCRRLAEHGMPLSRVVVSIRTIHPQILASTYFWRPGAKAVEADLGHDVLNDPAYLNSPFKVIHDGAGGLRRRLEGAADEDDFDVLGDLREQGATDYVAMPLIFNNGDNHVITLASDRPGGFGTAELKMVYDLLPVLSLILEVQSSRRIARTLLDTYVGHQAGERILRGEIKRGGGETIHAVLWFADLRGFTALSDSQPQREIIDLLNDYFELMAGPIHAHGGQILKFIGDGVLAIFPLADAGFRHYVCRGALQAAAEAIEAMAALNRGRADAGRAPIRFGLGLHVGDVTYGNIGAPDRLDFTAIGPAVNLTVRLEALSAKLGETIVISSAFAAVTERPLVPLGKHA